MDKLPYNKDKNKIKVKRRIKLDCTISDQKPPQCLYSCQTKKTEGQKVLLSF